MKKGGITVYLSLVFVILLSFVGGVLQSGWLQTKKNHRRGDIQRGMECCFGEYHKELWERYGILGIDGSYGVGEFSLEKVMKRILWYAEGEFEMGIRGVSYLSDEGGIEIFRQAVAGMKSKYFLDEVMEQRQEWETQEKEEKILNQEGKEKYASLEMQLKEEDKEWPSQQNPVTHIGRMESQGLLPMVLPGDMEVSKKIISLEESLEFRERRKGFGLKNIRKVKKTTPETLLFHEYLLDAFSFFTNQKEDTTLSYEVEYLLFGRENDEENLEETVKMLQKLRFLPNYLYLQSDEEMKLEAEAMAGTVATLLGLPSLTEVVAQLILIAWAYGEGIMDVRALLKGGRIPAVKTKESWQLQLSRLLELGTEKDAGETKTFEKGQSYKDYLRALLYLKKKEPYELRGLAQIERNLRIKQDSFRIDGSIIRLDIECKAKLPRSLIYQFSSGYGYE